MVAGIPVVRVLLQPVDRNQRGRKLAAEFGDRLDRRLAQQSGQGRLDRFGEHALAMGVRMQGAGRRPEARVVKQLGAQLAVTQKDRPHIQISDTRIVAITHCQALIDLRIAARFFAGNIAGQHAHQQDVRARQFLFDRRDHRIDAQLSLLGGLAEMAGVVGADQHQGNLGLQTVDLAIGQPPQHVLGAVAAEAQIERAAAAVEGLPGRLELFVRRLRFFVVLGDRIADQQQRRVGVLFDLLQHLRVSLRPPGFLQAVGGYDRGRWRLCTCHAADQQQPPAHKHGRNGRQRKARKHSVRRAEHARTRGWRSSDCDPRAPHPTSADAAIRFVAL
ncbi:hypothetical protein XHC_1853 [Xanthomonas hortorum pv. carotae str. M081]|nr:hypothetical protein XHC_1853 [Xanthomonas hortorum pv. carotae str. M081]